jgi:GTPase
VHIGLCVQGIPVDVLEKTALVAPSDDDLHTLVERLNIRLTAGHGECIYEVGVAEHSDDAGRS